MGAVIRTRGIFLVVVVVLLGVAVPVQAAGFDAQNAKKVDGLQATKSTTNASKRRGKLVATDRRGLLPNNIVALVAHAQRADRASSLSCTACVFAPALASSNPPAAGQVLGFGPGGLVWQDAGVGTITALSTSGGLTGGGSSGPVSVGVDPTRIQTRVSGMCAGNNAIQQVNQDGTVRCQPTVLYSDANHNVAAGPRAFNSTFTGIRNTALGDSMMNALTTGSDNTASGFTALGSTTSGVLNVADGSAALASNTTGSGNVAVGPGALRSSTITDNNTAIGNGALLANTTGTQNDASGFQALGANTGGNSNVASGYQALFANTSGSSNVAVGDGALLSNSTGVQNVGVGVDAGAKVTGGSNVAIGPFALLNSTAGNGNIGLGFQAGSNVTTGANNIEIGNAGLSGDAGNVRIGDSGQTATFITAINGTSITGPTQTVLVNSFGQLGTATASSAALKRDVRPLGVSAGRRLLSLRPVSYRYKKRYADGSNPLQYGLIAEQVAHELPALVQYDKARRPTGVYYQELPALLLAELKREHAQLQRERGRNRSQDQQIAALRRAVARLARGH